MSNLQGINVISHDQTFVNPSNLLLKMSVYFNKYLHALAVTLIKLNFMKYKSQLLSIFEVILNSINITLNYSSGGYMKMHTNKHKIQQPPTTLYAIKLMALHFRIMTLIPNTAVILTTSINVNLYGLCDSKTKELFT